MPTENDEMLNFSTCNSDEDLNESKAVVLKVRIYLAKFKTPKILFFFKKKN